MGTVLLRAEAAAPDRGQQRFSPLLDGDGVASVTVTVVAPVVLVSFSPLLDGDGVASDPGATVPVGPVSFSPLLDGDGVASVCDLRLSISRPEFQSPSRWGRCCFSTATW